MAVLVVLLAALNPATPGGWGLLLLAVGVVGAFAFWRARISDERDGTLRLTFDFDNAGQRYTALTSALARLASCQRVWAVETEQKTGDWKRNAGATSLVKRTLVQPSSVLPKGVESSHEVICLPAGKQKLYFFPNALLVYDRHGVEAISYTELKSEADAVAFTEEQETPSDGQVLRTTWRYVNKSGGPDRRFSNNVELRVMKYGVLALRSSSGLNELFHASDHRVIEPINGAINAIGAVQVQASRRNDDTGSAHAPRPRARE